MTTIAVRLLIFLAIVYAGLAAIIYFQQSAFIFPAPQDVYQPAPGYKAVTLEAADGLALTAHWRAPSEGRATLVHFHGNSGSLSGATAENQLFADQGYGVLLVGYRGYGGNPGAPSEAGFREDGRAALAFLKARSIAPESTILKGHSIGCGTAVNMALEHEAAALILVAPFTSITDLLTEKMPIFPMRLLLGDPFDNRAKIPSVAMPTLIQHGSADAVVPAAHGRALANAGPTAQFQSFEGFEHDLSYDPRIQTAQSEWLATLSL
ncbi:MAG: alpha/beta fold hydrolase [Pseudomonadota bacterium]